MSETQKPETPAPEQNAQPSAESASQNAAAIDLEKKADAQDSADGGNAAEPSPTVSLGKDTDGQSSSSWIPPSSEYGEPGGEPRPEPFHSKWAALFNGCAKIGPLYILLFICVMVWPDYFQKGTGIYCPPEIRSVTAYLHCIQDSSWLAPIALDNGSWSAPQWPLFYCFIGLLALIPGAAEANWLIPLASAASAAIAVLGAFFFTHAAGFGVRAAFASALVLLCAPIFAPLHHFFGPIALSAGLTLFSLAFFCRGWRAQRAWISLPLAFICAGLAGLSGGVLYIAVPFIGSLFFLIWQGKYRRGQSLDAITGFLLMLIIVGLWIGAVALGDYPDFYLSTLFADSLSLSWPPQPFWQLALAAGVIGLMPWTLSIFGVSWIRVLKDCGQSLKSSRGENSSALMWISLALACCLTPFVPHTPLNAIAIAALTAPLLGKALARLAPAGNRFFFGLASILAIAIGGALLAVHFEATQSFIVNLLPLKPPSFATDELKNLTGVPIIGGILILAGLLGFFFAKRDRGLGGMIYASIVTAAVGQAAMLMIAPNLQNNPALPLKTMSAIAMEVEQAKAAPAAPAQQTPPATPAPESPSSAQPAAPAGPDVSAPESAPIPLPNLSIPPENQLQEQEPAAPPVEVPQPPREPAPAMPPAEAPEQAQPEAQPQAPPQEKLPEAAPAPQEGTIPSAPEMREAPLNVTDLPPAAETEGAAGSVQSAESGAGSPGQAIQ